MLLFTIVKFLHVLAGFTALAIFWVPIVTPKGGKAHVRFGWIYVGAMGTVAVSASYMGVWRIVFDPERNTESISFAWFLIFIAILSAATAWYGLRVLRFKRRADAHRHPLEIALPALLLLSGIGISAYGFYLGFPLLAYFPIVGIFLGSTQLAYWLRRPKQRMHWWFEHISGMMGCCIATITAFTVFGAPRLLNLSSVSPIVWFVPTLVLVPVIIAMNIHYRKTFAK
ncbi:MULTISPECIES: DUF2306 domain-containing protein [unclassified Paenibacillus]|uniref:DUF2306 domain-containing protein n=1 Tax=unclassified Paenibacillus TaxID=185978 RepID=UPI001AE12ACA|nr:MULTISPECIES: DUF2306 domain-containing protein [unclassified Paenibacillus]MBP1153915.1 putative membrane protein [Paenibacillus sp. PvP091]MBP1170700.1 putative membrane protein [Paenibacillus sp. PvR098]MBP2441728.1 putative membrane protein [Paenibacillus sp. PvP052]